LIFEECTTGSKRGFNGALRLFIVKKNNKLSRWSKENTRRFYYGLLKLGIGVIPLKYTLKRFH